MKATLVGLPAFETFRAGYLAYWWAGGSQFWLFTVFDKDEAIDLTAGQRQTLKVQIKAELAARRSK